MIGIKVRSAHARQWCVLQWPSVPQTEVICECSLVQNEAKVNEWNRSQPCGRTLLHGSLGTTLLWSGQGVNQLLCFDFELFPAFELKPSPSFQLILIRHAHFPILAKDKVNNRLADLSRCLMLISCNGDWVGDTQASMAGRQREQVACVVAWHRLACQSWNDFLADHIFQRLKE